MFPPEKVMGDAYSGEVETHLDEALQAGRNDLHAASTKPEQENQDESREYANHHDAVHLKRSSYKQEPLGKKFVDRGTVEAPVIARGRDHQVHSGF